MRGKWGWVAAAAVAVVLVVAGVQIRRLRRLAGIGAGYVAKEGCSCVFIAGRSLEACRADMPPSMAEIAATVDASAKEVRARVPLLADRRARFREGFGCTLY